MNDYERGWITGFFEGEGCISVSMYNGSKLYPRIQIASTDKLLLVKVRRLVGYGRIYKHTPSGSLSRKQGWVWVVASIGECHEVINMIYPGLSPRRKAQADKALAITYERGAA